ncbi:hypothetical protein PPSC2_12220 [Paenibacillus polymyxa SC2]|uniref:Uncharacterized protein n=1 Tax=Paenibacillus polymyxa (strain SC2) TaxID=886882 RepID=A0A0D5ZBT7_PAEPS|nr:hypothetical protein PPSC2_12220 [Paenibacillus polymyxa SC2]
MKNRKPSIKYNFPTDYDVMSIVRRQKRKPINKCCKGKNPFFKYDSSYFFKSYHGAIKKKTF